MNYKLSIVLGHLLELLKSNNSILVQNTISSVLTDLSHPDTRSVKTDEMVLPIIMFTSNID